MLDEVVGEVVAKRLLVDFVGTTQHEDTLHLVGSHHEPEGFEALRIVA